MLEEAIILAGGLGTRLRKVVKNVPKPMAEINRKPFLEYLLMYLANFKIKKIILAVGYKYEIILKYFGNTYQHMKLIYSVEEELLGTGGAIKKALSFAETPTILVLNGDTFFKINLFEFWNFHIIKQADLSIALKSMKNFDRYGTVKIDKENRIIGFEEKSFKKEGLINGGFYLLNKKILEELPLPEKFSFEKDFLEKYYRKFKFYGLPFDEYFIDIGTPEHYQKACSEFWELSFTF